MAEQSIHELVLKSDVEGVQELIAQKAPLDTLDELGHTPLHWAVFRGDIDIVKLLLEAGANPNTFSADGVTPKWRAKDFGLDEIVALLESYRGKVLTNADFDRTSSTVFGEFIGQPIPVEELSTRSPSDLALLGAWLTKLWLRIFEIVLR